MCGIFAVLPRHSERQPPTSSEVIADAQQAVDMLSKDQSAAAINEVASLLKRVNQKLMGTPGAVALTRDATLRTQVASHIAAIENTLRDVEDRLDDPDASSDLETLNAACVELRGATWSISRDRLATADAVVKMAGPLLDQAGEAAIGSYLAIQLSLSNIDRLEVRGRDSAGIAVCIERTSSGSAEDVALAAELEQRVNSLFLDSSVIVTPKTFTFVYKAAAEIGALGDNVAGMRQTIESDALLGACLLASATQATVVAHTRWASVGTVSEANAHPVDSRERDEVSINENDMVIASLNGDVDNHATLKANSHLSIEDEITTDAKVIPVLVKRALSNGPDFTESFREVVASFVGSVAIVASRVSDPSKLWLAVKGSGQGCYVGFTEDAFVVASEPYGLVEVCDKYLRLDGETPSPKGATGQVVVLDRNMAGDLNGLERLSYAGEQLAIDESELVAPEVTTRDIDRGGAPHFLLKEILESPNSVAKTVRGKIVTEANRLTVSLPETTLPADVLGALGDGSISQVLVIGQGTAAVAGQSLAAVLKHICHASLSVDALPATELSGFGLRDDMSDCLVIAVSQSGTTTDTNRTVDLVRTRGASVIAIVNRRNSDLAEKADGVLYTSDGRDIEMSVASTKAFYSQVAACILLGVAIAKASGEYDKIESVELLRALRELPDAMREVLNNREQIGEIAAKFAPPKKSWALVGNGPNAIAARELRIKLSELCYKSIACDITEDKKHIDLSSEPLIFVCAAGVTDSNAADVMKEIAIYSAHKATPIVVVSKGADVPKSAAAVVEVPTVQPFVDFILSTVVGHLFGYEAALAIDAQAKLVRVVRAEFDDAVAHSEAQQFEGEQLMHIIGSAIAGPSRQLLGELRSGRMNGHIEPSIAVELATMLRVATGTIPLDSLEADLGRTVTPYDMIELLAKSLSAAADELTRPIDAVKHQAKTVTVGISRTEDSHNDNALLDALTDAGVDRNQLPYRTLRTVSAIASVVNAVTGFTVYDVIGDPRSAEVTARVRAKQGVANQLESRVEANSRLVGVKHRAAFEKLVTIGRGERDGRTFVIVPEVQHQKVVGLVLLHVDFEDRVAPDVAKKVLATYRDRYSALVDAVTETYATFDDSVLGEIPFIDLMTLPVRELAQSWSR